MLASSPLDSQTTEVIANHIHFSWEPSQIDTLPPTEIVLALGDVVGLTRHLQNNYTNRLIAAEDKVKEAQNNLNFWEKAKNSKPFVWLFCSISAFLLAFILIGLAESGELSFLMSIVAWLLFFPVLAMAFYMLVVFFKEAIRKAGASEVKHQKLLSELESAKAAHQAIDDETMAWATRNRECFVKAKALLPNYYYKETALLEMIAILNNHRARTLGEALNLYLADTNATQRLVMQADMVYAAERAANAANSAAASAHTVAVNATIAANNTK